MQSKLYLISLGCAKNMVDTEVMLGSLGSYIISDNIEDSNIIIINTCGFIQSAKEESLDVIFECIKNKRKDAILVVAGCLTHRYKEELTKEFKNDIDIITGVGDYDKIGELIKMKSNAFSKKTFLQKENTKRVIVNSKLSAYIKISEGCNQNCSFCAIPNFKGRLQSRKLEDIKQEIISLNKQGFKEFIFISQDTSSYGKDLKMKNGLLRLINDMESLFSTLDILSAKVLYLYPTTLNKEIIEALSTSKYFETYYDIPLQHMSNHMLEIMDRKSTREEQIKLLNLMKMQKNSFIRTSFIIGHPGESEKDFEELKEFCKEFDFDRVNIFEYSQEEDTKAYDMTQIDKDTIKRRVKEIDKIIEKSYKKSLSSLVGKDIKVILEGKSEESEFFYSARAINWVKDIDSEILINDTLIDVKQEGIYIASINELIGDKLVGVIKRESK